MANSREAQKFESDEPALKLAVLIDADNAKATVIEGLLAEIARFGEATVKRIYGDFTSPRSAQWKKVLNRHAIKPVQQFAYTTGKNATDSTLIIEAMDLLYTRRFDGFCLVSSDSDFTGLALRIREEGLTVLGFGEQKTPDAFRNACHKFIFTEVLKADEAATAEEPPRRGAASKKEAATATPQAPATPAPQSKKFPRKFVLEALEMASDDDGWANLGTFGSYMTKLQPDFDSRLYGFSKLSNLVRSMPNLFECEEREVSGAAHRQLYIRAKPRG
ncbi:MAG TPA: NYN domain-containing protein [Oceanipulchritudo sp.]|nr:NYN domain-containing protein [Oceanipulchritudo sp.]